MDDPNDTLSFTPIDTVSLTNWMQWFAVDLSAYTGTGRFLAFKGITRQGYSRDIWLTHVRLTSSMVTGLHADQVTDNSMLISWELLGEGIATLRVTDENNTVVLNTTATSPYTLTGLTAGMLYSISVSMGFADSVNPCAPRPLKVRTLAEALTVPTCMGLQQVENTEQSDIYDMPLGWTRAAGNGYPRYSSERFRSERSLEFYTYNCDNSSLVSTMAVSPYISEGLSNYFLDFYVRNYNNGCFLLVGTVASPWDTASFVPHDTIDYHNNWTHISLPLANYGGNYLAFRYQSTSCNSGYAYIDDLSLMRCPLPHAWYTHQEDTSVWIHWDGDSPVWVEYAFGGDFTPGNGTKVLAQSSPLVVSPLVSAASYTFHVWPQCEGDGNFACNYDVLHPNTMHPPVAIPYCYNFETMNSGGFPDEWSRWEPDNTYCRVTTYDGHDDSRSLRLYSWDKPAVAIMPKVQPSTLCSDSVFLNFWYRRYSGNEGQQLIIGTVSEITDTTSFTAIDTITLADYDYSWHHHTTALPASLLFSQRIAFRTPYGADLFVDNLCLETCMATDVEVRDITQNSATVVWNGHGVDTLVCEYGPQGFAQGTGTVVNITSSPYTITPLEPSTQYNFIFRTICSCNEAPGAVYPAGGGTGGGVWWDGVHWNTYAWVDTNLYPGYGGWGLGYGGGGGWGAGGGLNIGSSTQSEPLTLPYCQDFDSLDIHLVPGGWRRISGSINGYPQTVNEPVLSGARALDFYTTTGYSNHAALPPISHTPLTPSPSGEGLSLTLNFSAMATHSEANYRPYGVFTVGLMTDPDQGSTFLPLDTIAIGNERWQRYSVTIDPSQLPSP